jgi:hypothetical protein
MTCYSCEKNIDQEIEKGNVVECVDCGDMFCAECATTETEVCSICGFDVCNSCVKTFDDMETISNWCNDCNEYFPDVEKCD